MAKSRQQAEDAIRSDPIEQLIHVGATPKVLRELESGVRHLNDVVANSADAMSRLRKEITSLRTVERAAVAYLYSPSEVNRKALAKALSAPAGSTKH